MYDPRVHLNVDLEIIRMRDSRSRMGKVETTYYIVSSCTDIFVSSVRPAIREKVERALRRMLNRIYRCSVRGRERRSQQKEKRVREIRRKREIDKQ